MRTRAALTCVVANGTTSHAPMVHAGVRGCSPLFVLDTGSDVHLLTKELVDEAGLRHVDGDEGVDHSGASIPSWRVEDTELHLAGASLKLRNPVAIPAPPRFAEWGIGGIVSPQNLFEGWTVIDMASDELVLVTGTEREVATFLDARADSMKLLAVERDPAFESVVVPASIADRPQAIPTLLNTGGRYTEFAVSALPTAWAVQASTRVRVGGALSGTEIVGSGLGDATVVVGGHRLTVPLVVREAMVGPQGMIGMDVLRGTILTVSHDVSRSVFWQLAGSA